MIRSTKAHSFLHFCPWSNEGVFGKMHPTDSAPSSEEMEIRKLPDFTLLNAIVAMVLLYVAWYETRNPQIHNPLKLSRN